MLDKRLACAASSVRPGSRLADIGTDHAQLPVWLVEKEICPCAIAVDLREGPLRAAQRTIQKAGLEACIEVRLGDGLSPIKAYEADDIVIAGMGGETIAAILSAADWVRDERYNWVLQPMSRPEELRRWLLTNGFALVGERIVHDGSRVYTVIQAHYSAAPAVLEESAYWIGGVPPRKGMDYLRGQLRRVKTRISGLRCHDAHHPDIAGLERVAKAIEEYMSAAK